MSNEASTAIVRWILQHRVGGVYTHCTQTDASVYESLKPAYTPRSMGVYPLISKSEIRLDGVVLIALGFLSPRLRRSIRLLAGFSLFGFYSNRFSRGCHYRRFSPYSHCGCPNECTLLYNWRRIPVSTDSWLARLYNSHAIEPYDRPVSDSEATLTT